MKRVVGALLAAAATGAFGQAFPTRPITLIVPYAAGGSADVVARPVAAEMGKLLGENVVVELRPGAGGNIGAEYVARSARAVPGYQVPAMGECLIVACAVMIHAPCSAAHRPARHVQHQAS